MALTRDAAKLLITNVAEQFKSEEVYVPEFGDTVIVRQLTVRQWEKYQASLLDMRGDKPKPKVDSIRVPLVALSAVDEAGNQLFTEAELARFPASPVDRLYDVAIRLNKMRNEDAEELAENFGSTPNED
jgi:hypothetical protein